MTETTTLSRRAVLGTVGSAAVLALAGCSSSASPNGQTQSPTSTATQSPTSTDGHSEDENFASKQDVERLPSEPVQDATVQMTMVSESEPVFSPEITWVNSGGSVTWKNVDEDPHTTSAYAPSNDKPRRIPDGVDGWDSGTLQTDEKFSQTFDTEGVYDYYCLPHEALGMVGVVVVGRPDTAGQPAMAPLQDNIPESAGAKLTELHKKVETILSG